MKISEPKNELFTMMDDKLIYLWDVEEKEMRFMIRNLQGNILNNISIKFPKSSRFFEDIQVDERGRFYSYHVSKNKIDIFEWR